MKLTKINEAADHRPLHVIVNQHGYYLRDGIVERWVKDLEQATQYVELREAKHTANQWAWSGATVAELAKE